MPANLDVFSVTAPILGNAMYGTLLRRGFGRVADIAFDPHWTTDDIELPARALNRALWQKFPLPALHERNLDLQRFRSELGVSLLARRLVERALTRRTPDVLHFHTQNTALLSQAYMRRIPAVITTDQTNAQIALEYPAWTRWTHRPSIALERRAARAAHAIVVFSQWAAASFIDDYGVAPQRVHVIPIGIELDGFDRLPSRGVRGHGKKRLLFVGGDFERKGGALLVDVFRQHFADEDVELHLMTSDPAAVSGGRVVVHRDVAPLSAAWYELYASADIFVLPTRRDAFGIAYIEAMAAGLPVIGTRIGAGPEIVSDDVGFLIEPNDRQALARCIRTAARRCAASLGARGTRSCARACTVRRENAYRTAS